MDRDEEGQRKRVLTGDRPTGKLHLGHWVGSLRNRVRAPRRMRVFLSDGFLAGLDCRQNVIDYIFREGGLSEFQIEI